MLFFSCFIALARTSSIMLSGSGKSRHPCLAPHLRICLIYWHKIVHDTPYYPFNICRIYRDVTSLNPDIGNLYLFLFFLINLVRKSVNFIDLFKEPAFGFFDFLYFLFLFSISLISFLELITLFILLIWGLIFFFSFSFLKVEAEVISSPFFFSNIRI